MNYEILIQTLTEILENEKINKNGLTLVYELDENNHKQMNEQLFYKSNPPSAKLIPSNVFEVAIGGIIVRFVKKTSEDL